MIITVKDETMAKAARILIKTDPRDYVTYIKVADGQAYFTDSKRIARIPTTLEDGYYQPTRVVKSGVDLVKTEDIDYPNCGPVFDTSDHKDISSDIGPAGFIWSLARATTDKDAWNPQFIQHAVDMVGEIVSVYYKTNAPLILEGLLGTAGVMPLRVD